MKYFISRSLPVIFLLVLALFNGCKPEYNVETIVGFPEGEQISTQEKQATKEQLAARLSESLGDNFVVEEVEQGFRIITAHRNQPIAAMAGLMGYFGSAEMGLYDVMDIDNPKVKSMLDSFYFPEYIEVVQARDPYRRHLVATTINAARKDQVLEELNASVPIDLPLIFKWSMAQDPAPGQGGGRTYNLYALRTSDRSGTPRITNSGIAAAKVESTQQGQIAVSVTMTPEATTEWASMTEQAAADDYRPVAIVVNNEVISSPSVRTAITGGMTQITGNFSVEEAEALAQQLKWKPLPADLILLSQEVIE